MNFILIFGYLQSSQFVLKGLFPFMQISKLVYNLNFHQEIIGKLRFEVSWIWPFQPSSVPCLALYIWNIFKTIFHQSSCLLSSVQHYISKMIKIYNMLNKIDWLIDCFFDILFSPNYFFRVDNLYITNEMR